MIPARPVRMSGAQAVGRKVNVRTERSGQRDSMSFGRDHVWLLSGKPQKTA